MTDASPTSTTSLFRHENEMVEGNTNK